ncbi:MAG: rhodanese-related sulfurtransferase [Rhizobiales bacterium]|nr:rhodanese-related sulfurtransferase [Hyphomicrobiales bacterium]NRB15083.1 rhodanese-related sulfurtransferase [Hyphomicrobiales bacterium]
MTNATERSETAPITVTALYHFTKLPDYKQLRDPLLKFMKSQNIKGTLLLAAEGINGTVAGTAKAVQKLHDYLRADERFAGLVTKESFDEKMPFYRTKVKLKKEIVTMGVENIDPNHIVGTYVKPEDWNDLIADPDVLVVDTRNDYEVGIGTFKNALNPQTDTFREFPAYVKENLGNAKGKKIAMFCTGGIRCEKSTAYLKQQGFEDVYHLQGGILKYLENVPEEESLWEGECFVFDSRVAVKHKLEIGQYDQCYACRMPITEADKDSEHYIKGISCHHCHDQKTRAQTARYTQRELQIALSGKHGEQHIGGDVFGTIEARREAKKLQRQADRKRNSASSI